MKLIFTFLLLLSIFSTAFSEYCNLNEYKECFFINDNYNQNIDVKALCSENCKKFYNEILPNCGVDNKSSKIVELSCITDEEGNFCPITQEYSQTTNNGKEKSRRLADESCKSKSCTDALIKMYELIIDEDYLFAKEMIDRLNSKECRNQNVSTSSSYKSTTGNQTNDSDSASKETKKNNSSKGIIIGIVIFFIVIGLILITLGVFIYIKKSDKKNKMKNVEKEIEEKEEKPVSDNDNNIVNQTALAPYLVTYYPKSGIIQPLSQVDPKTVPGLPQIAPGSVPGVTFMASPVAAPVASSTVIPISTVTSSESIDIKKE